MTLALLLALLIGVSLGVLGSGGSIITVPVLVYVAGIPVHQAVAMSLVIVGATAAAGSVVLGRRHGIDGRTAAVLAATGSAGAYVGARFSALVPGDVLLLLLGLLMVVAGARLLRRRPQAAPHARQTWAIVPVGLVLGGLTGFLGVGGGFLIVPALLLFSGLDMKRAVPTSLAIIACNSAAGLAGQLHTTAPDWTVTVLLLLASLTGMAVGAAMASRANAETLLRVFAWMTLLLGAGMVARNVAALASLM